MIRFHTLPPLVKTTEDGLKIQKIFEEIFANILGQAMDKGFVDSKIQFVDATHVKAHANRHKNKREEIKVQAKAYQEDLEKEIDEDRKEHGKTLKRKKVKAKKQEKSPRPQQIQKVDFSIKENTKKYSPTMYKPPVIKTAGS